MGGLWPRYDLGFSQSWSRLPTPSWCGDSYSYLSCWCFSCRGISAEPGNSLQATSGLQINFFVPSPLYGLRILILSIFFNLEISPKKEKSRSLAFLGGKKKIRKSANTGPTFLPYKMDWSWVAVDPFKQGTCSPVHHHPTLGHLSVKVTECLR